MIIQPNQPYALWTVRDRDQTPNRYLARRYTAKGGQMHPTSTAIATDDLAALHATLASNGLSPIGWSPSHDADLLEVWG